MLDTSAAIALRDGHPAVLKLLEERHDSLCLSVITIVELEGGVGRSEAGRTIRRAALDAMYESFDVLSFGIGEAQRYGDIVRELGFVRRKITDRMIAATALASGAELATLNARDFEGIAGLQILDWAG